MTAYYRVIQFVPDNVRNERVNIGVVTFSPTEHLSQFLQNWRRVKYFGGDEHFLRSVADEISRMSPDELTSAADRWQNCVQISLPAASLLDPGELLLDVSKRYLVDPEVTERAYRTSAEVRRRAMTELKDAVSSVINRAATKLLKGDEIVLGKFDGHSFDIAAKNGQLIFAANAISFQVPDHASLRKNIDAAAWAIDDVRKQQPELPLAVVAAEPQENGELFQRARKMYEGLGATVITEPSVGPWATKMAELMNEHLPDWLKASDKKRN